MRMGVVPDRNHDMGYPIHYCQRHTGHDGRNNMVSRMFHIHSRTQDKERMTHKDAIANFTIALDPVK